MRGRRGTCFYFTSGRQSGRSILCSIPQFQNRRQNILLASYRQIQFWFPSPASRCVLWHQPKHVGGILYDAEQRTAAIVFFDFGFGVFACFVIG